MKNIMWKYSTANNTQKYIDVLPSMVERYNNTYHHNMMNREMKLAIGDELQTLFHPIVNATKQAAEETRKELARTNEENVNGY